MKTYSNFDPNKLDRIRRNVAKAGIFVEINDWKLCQGLGNMRQLGIYEGYDVFLVFRKAKVNHRHHKTPCKPKLYDKTFQFRPARCIFIRYTFNIIISCNSITKQILYFRL
jgi:hypothetical protein